MQPVIYRNFGDHESLVVAHSVAVGSGGGIRWYEIRNPGGTPTLYQQGTYAPDSGFRWMPSISINNQGDIAIGYSVSSSSVSPSIAYAGQTPSDTLGSLESEVTVVSGSGSTSTDRWGDYSGMHVDPVDDCTFWYTGEYMAANGMPWRTQIASFKVEDCVSCGTGLAACSGKCVNTNTDSKNCGKCGNQCSASLSCSKGQCKCASGYTLCSGKCVNTSTDLSNCGRCGNECQGINKCTSGACIANCPVGLLVCGSGKYAYCARSCGN